MAASEPVGASLEESESDFEYEYADDDTEDFYFTLDVTTHGLRGASKADELTSRRKSKGRQAAKSIEQLQVLDVHSDNPLIKLGDSFYSCNWSTDLGTQFYVAKAGTFKESVRPGYVLDVIGISQARLTGRPVTLHRRDAKIPTPAAGSSSTNAIALDGDEDQAIEGTASDTQLPPVNKNVKRLAAVRNRARDPNVKAQASFLERLAIIKQRKGEKDVLPVYGIEELSSRNDDGGSPSNNLNSNGKRASPADENIGGMEANGPSSNRRLSTADDSGDGDQNGTHLPSSSWNSEVPLERTATSSNKAP